MKSIASRLPVTMAGLMALAFATATLVPGQDPKKDLPAKDPPGKQGDSGEKSPQIKLRLALSGHTGDVQSVAYSPDGVFLASGDSNGAVKLWDVTTGKCTASLSGHTSGVSSVAFSPDGKTLASGGGPFLKPGEVKLWDVITRKEKASFGGHNWHVFALSFSSDGKTLAASDTSETILWEVATGNKKSPYNDPFANVRRLIYSPVGNAATVLKNETVIVTKPGKSPPDGNGTPIAYSPDGGVLALRGDKGVNLWDISTGKMQCQLKQEGVTSVAFSPDGETIATNAATNLTVKVREGMSTRQHTYLGALVLWDCSSGEVRAHLLRDDKVTAIAFNPCGGNMASGEGKLVKVWDVRDVLPDKGKLQGTWRLVSLEENGQSRTPNSAVRLVIKGNQMTQRIDNMVVNTAMFQLEPNRKPKWVDVTDKTGKTSKGIYQLGMDSFEICIPHEGDLSSRPEELSAKEGSKQTFLKYRREGP